MKYIEENGKMWYNRSNVIVTNGIKLSPKKMNLFSAILVSLLTIILSRGFMGDFGNKFMYQGKEDDRASSSTENNK
ncbi:MAG: hypothetical protein HDR28_05740 [Lachnospiraceae bacterium]|nr:hypothetical protein [Lachnospiraceae bacterium]